MISQLVEAKPDDLRLYLEEAAGISKYKERRRETENRIRHTQENLDRLNDIREELDRQLQHLKRQARAAERYRELKDEERRLTAELRSLELATLDAELDGRQTRIAELEVQLEQVNSERQSIDTQIEKARSDHSEASESFNAVQGRFYQLGADIARIEEAIQFNEERVRQLELDLETVSQRSEDTGRQLAMDEGEIDRLDAEIAGIAPRVQVAKREDTEASSQLETLEADEREWQQQWDAFSNRASENDREAEVQASRVEHLEQLLQRLRARLAQLETDEQGVPVVPGEQVDSLAEEINQVEFELNTFESEVDVCLKDLAAAREDVLMRERVLEEARGEVQALRHDLASLEAVQQAALGRDYSETRAWVEANGLGDAERVGEALAVVPGWERAVETVLGHYLQALRVSSIEDHLTALGELPAGQVALVEATRESEPSAGDLPALGAMVRSDGMALGSLLAGVFVAESSAVAMANRGMLELGQSIITRDGFWVGVDWVRMIKSDEDDAGIIERSQELETLNLRVEQAETTLTELQTNVADARARITRLEAERESLQARVAEQNARLGQLRADHGVHRVRKEEADARRERVARERAEIGDQIHEEQQRLQISRERLQNSEVLREQLDQERVALVEVRDANNEALGQVRQQARATRDAYHQLNATWQNLQSRRDASRTARQRLVAQQEELKERREQLESGIDTNATPILELKVDLEARLADRVQVEEELASVRRALESLDAEVRRLDAERGNKETRLNEVRETLEGARVERQGVVVQRDNTLTQFDATGLDLETVRAELDAEATEAGWREELDKLARRIERLGAINLAAIEEFETQSERKVYLDAQHDDLVAALETLQTAIRKIDKETRSRFKETFEEVNTRLGNLFPKVFGGGHAYLELTGEDLLDTGVSLMARPPGKRNASVHLLSGGEKAMTAVALIFAIFQLNPSPVCLLDEVDAPLDDSNVVRFANLIKEMSADVQFVVITHNKLTMEMADHLMGVTMHEPGVSRLVSVDVEEAAALAAV